MIAMAAVIAIVCGQHEFPRKEIIDQPYRLMQWRTSVYIDVLLVEQLYGPLSHTAGNDITYTLPGKPCGEKSGLVRGRCE